MPSGGGLWKVFRFQLSLGNLKGLRWCRKTWHGYHSWLSFYLHRKFRTIISPALDNFVAVVDDIYKPVKAIARIFKYKVTYLHAVQCSNASAEPFTSDNEDRNPRICDNWQSKRIALRQMHQEEHSNRSIPQVCYYFGACPPSTWQYHPFTWCGRIPSSPFASAGACCLRGSCSNPTWFQVEDIQKY